VGRFAPVHVDRLGVGQHHEHVGDQLARQYIGQPERQGRVLATGFVKM
jgi:hypothetical protein